MVNRSNFTVQQGSTVAFKQALHLGDKEDSHSHARVVHPLILIVALPIDSTPPNCPSPPPKKAPVMQAICRRESGRSAEKLSCPVF